MKVTVQLEGFKEMGAQLGRLKRSTGKAVLRRSLIKAGEPMAEIMRSLAPVDSRSRLHMRDLIGVATRLSRRQARLHRKMFADDRSAVEVFVGVAPDPASWTQEFGTVNHSPQPFARPAWDRDHGALIKRLGDLLWTEITKSVARAAKRGTLKN